MTMMRRSLGMMSKMSSVVNRLAVITVLAVLLGLSGMVTIASAAWTDNPLLHNSNRFPTNRHTTGWGIPGQYGGAFTCDTCHAKATGNIKRIKASISFPSGIAMPDGGVSSAVNLQSAVDGSSDFGDDSVATGGVPRISSNKICEVCHTVDATQAAGVKQHAAMQQTVSNHYDKADCIKCHLHSAGFKADCTTCHGNPPAVNSLGGPTGLSNTPITGSATAGKHTLHAVTKAYACNTCHTGWTGAGEMPNAGNINIGFNAFGDTTAAYNGRTGGAYTRAAGTTGTDNDTLTCSAVYCHGTSTPKWLDTAGAMACGSCHGDTTGAPIETAGDGDLAGLTSGPKVGKHVKHVAKYACSLCHKGAGNGTTLHVNGTNDIIFDTALAGPSATFTPNTVNGGTCSNLSCHSNQIWNTTTPALACNSCHGYPPTSASDPANNKHVGVTPVNHDKTAGVTTALTGNHKECNTCHGKSSTNGLTLNLANGGDNYLASYHMDNQIEMNGWATDSGQDAQYQQSGVGAYGCAKACHANDPAHQLSDSGMTVQLHRYGSGDCAGCHDTGAGGAPTVTAASSHSTNTTGKTCVDCHTSHGAGTIEIPNNTTVGINYTANGETGIALGSSTVTGATEAEICWGCHTATQNEWNASPYSASTENWTTAVFTVAGGAGIPTNRPVRSVHTANSAVTGISSVDEYVNQADRHNVEAVAQIRCSYCHDLHSLGKNGYTPTAKPWLRGTWMANPYSLDSPPMNGTTYNTNNYGTPGPNAPRLFATTTDSKTKAGYFIDQNSDWPTVKTPATGTFYTSAETAGLCELCHTGGTSTLNQYSSNLWNGTKNGHANSTLGGSGAAAGNNIFDGTRGLTSSGGGTWMGSQHGAYLRSTRYNSTDNYGVNKTYGEPKARGIYSSWQPIEPAASGNRNIPPVNSGWYGGDAVDGSSGGLGDQYADWYTNGGTKVGTAGTYNIANVYVGTSPRAHNFTCSKCHDPHASGLPALLVTNCLDTTNATWNNNSTSKGPKATSGSNSGWGFAAATNCHRKRTGENGWNKLSPGL